MEMYSFEIYKIQRYLNLSLLIQYRVWSVSIFHSPTMLLIYVLRLSMVNFYKYSMWAGEESINSDNFCIYSINPAHYYFPKLSIYLLTFWRDCWNFPWSEWYSYQHFNLVLIFFFTDQCYLGTQVRMEYIHGESNFL